MSGDTKNLFVCFMAINMSSLGRIIQLCLYKQLCCLMGGTETRDDRDSRMEDKGDASVLTHTLRNQSLALE